MQNVLAAILLLVMPALIHAAPEYQEELHYQTVVPEQPGAEGKRIQVMEFFSFSCGHCYAFEPHLEKWQKQKQEDVDFLQVPLVFNRPEVMLHAKTFYALNLIGAEQSIHGKIFHALQVEKKRLRTEQEMEGFLQANGINLDEYRKAMNSFAVLTNVRKAAILAENYDIRGVPAVAVDGKYKLGGLEGETMIGIMNQLIGEVRKDKAAATTK